MTAELAAEGPKGFEVHLDNFEGPFDLLLSLISKHQLEITEVALARVTDEFLATIAAWESDWDLSQASEFLVVAATLLDLKAARLLPQGEVDDLEDLELLEARDLLFARLLQYRAFKQASGEFAAMLEAPRRVPRDVPLEPQFAMLLPELVWTATPDLLAQLAAHALQPKAAPAVSIAHLHNPAVSVREQAAVITGRLQREGAVSFRSLVNDAGHVSVVVARFLALLELFREAVVAFDQVRSLGELTVRWTGGDTSVEVSAEFDEDDALGVARAADQGEEDR
ncbi:segregation and condensation protein A [Demequina lignilytica]|uniref:Segregation and condensation protein A n=1 Tax=Demequina lignilytica TaxID=3051663 RepID=A0AB35MKY1_9MICO|nr:ScpA family protein [Demequina sp. SYSU T0a273]MDN4484475.1 ScpA family protein [Demequina sp. SYSU T0a273]